MPRNKRSIFLIGVAAIALSIGAGTMLAPKPDLMGNVSFSKAYYDRNGKLLRLSLAKDESYRLYTRIEDISPDLTAATLLQEDRYFYSHFGVNPLSILRGGYETYIRRSRAMGASTITMQLVRMRDHMDTRRISGKLLQMYKAIQLEIHYSKKEILEAYLNLAPYGGNIYGAGTASLIYFKQSAKNLALPQSIALAVIPQNPVKRFPLRADNAPWQEARQRLMTQLPQESARYYAALLQMPLTAYGRDDLPFLAPHFIDGLDGETPTGIINTTLDYAAQKNLEDLLQNYLRRNKFKGLDNASAMLVHVPTMELRALVGSADFSNTAIAGQVDGTRARRSPGSALKPFVYALALEQGLIHPETLLDDDPFYFAEYRPGNFDKRFIGKIPAREALVLSRNIPAIALAQQLSAPDIYEFLQSGGAGFPENKKYYGLSIVVGGAEIDMRTLVKLYAMLANGGVLQDIKSVQESVQARQGGNEPLRMLSAESALVTLDIMDHDGPDGALPFTKTQSRLPAYWKTGTSNGFRDAWAVGVFGPYALAVWTGHFDGRPNPALVGVETAAPLFFEMKRAIEAREDMADIVQPALKDLNIAKVNICPDTGEIGACGLTRASLFIPGRSPIAAAKIRSSAPEILSPRENIAYAFRYQDEEQLSIPLEAKNVDGLGQLHWFAGNVYLGTARNQTPLFWTPKPGEYVIRAVNDKGQADSRKISVILSE